MADSYIETLREPLEAIDHALEHPEGWSLLTPNDADEAKLVLNAAAHRARELRRLIAAASAAQAEAEREVLAARARAAAYEERLKTLEDNLVRPLCQGFGTSKTRQGREGPRVFDTGFAKVALCHTRPRLVLSASGREQGEANVIAMLPREYVRIIPPEPDRKAILEAIKDHGVVIHGFEIETTGTRIEWRG